MQQTFIHKMLETDFSQMHVTKFIFTTTVQMNASDGKLYFYKKTTATTTKNKQRQSYLVEV